MASNPIIRALRPCYESLFRLLAATPAKPTLLVKSRGCGFFGDVKITLNGIRFAEMTGIDCVVDWGKESLYFDPDAGKNVWEYFFSQSKFIFSHFSSRFSLPIPFYPSASDILVYEGLDRRESTFRAIERYCVPKMEITKSIDGYIREYFASETLGVHFRGTDAAAGYEGRQVIALGRLETEMDKWLSAHPSGNIFLASDDAFVVEYLARRFAGVLHFRDHLRSKDGTSLHGHYDKGVAGNGYRKGSEVLIDALLLSKCVLLFHDGGSQVSSFAKTRNPALPSVVLT